MMGWSFRRPLNLGPLKINLSRKGVGFSVGVRGFRIWTGRVGPPVYANVDTGDRNLSARLLQERTVQSDATRSTIVSTWL